MKPRRSDFTDEMDQCDHESYAEALDDWGEYQYELRRDREMEESIEMDQKYKEQIEAHSAVPFDQIVTIFKDEDHQYLIGSKSLHDVYMDIKDHHYSPIPF